jgi:hypothetical protein
MSLLIEPAPLVVLAPLPIAEPDIEPLPLVPPLMLLDSDMEPLPPLIDPEPLLMPDVLPVPLLPVLVSNVVPPLPVVPPVPLLPVDCAIATEPIRSNDAPAVMTKFLFMPCLLARRLSASTEARAQRSGFTAFEVQKTP